MRTNAWVRITDALAQTWRTWALWAYGDRMGPEPPLHSFAKEILRHTVDLAYASSAYKIATIDSVEWVMGSVHDVTKDQLQDGYTVYPNEWEVVGMWYWQHGYSYCQMEDSFSWKPDEALLFMPDECADPPDCASMVPATEVRDVSLLAGQPPRAFPSEARIV